MELNLLPELLNTGWFTIIDTGLFYGGEHMEAKYADSWLFWQKAIFFYGFSFSFWQISLNASCSILR